MIIKVIVVLGIIIGTLPTALYAESIEIEAAKTVRELVRLSDVVLIPLSKEGLEDVPEQCRITNFQIEGVIREYAYNYKGGKTPMHIARALNDLMRALEAVIDVTNDNDGVLSTRERVYWKAVIASRNSLFLLWCLHQNYEDVSRE